MFNENGNPSTYWGSENPVQESAISYIPEDVWNQSGPTLGLWSSSGGASAGNIGNGQGGTTPGVPKPSWQSLSITGVPNDGVRDLPDVSLTAATHDPYLLCLEGSCEPNELGEFYVYFIGGTSASAPSFAGIMALVDQQMANLNPGARPRQGQANYLLYRLAAGQAAYPSQCNGSSTSTPPTSTCIFNDVTVGNNVVPGEVGNDYQATTGYDQTTGLGSVNVANLVAQWNSVTFTPTTTTLALSPVTNITHGSSVNVTISVSPSSGTGHPSGSVSLLAANSINQTAADLFTLSGTSTVASSTNNLPGGGPYSVTAQYSGDATYAASDSGPVSVIVTPEPSTRRAGTNLFSRATSAIRKAGWITRWRGTTIVPSGDSARQTRWAERRTTRRPGTGTPIVKTIRSTLPTRADSTGGTGRSKLGVSPRLFLRRK
jgi:Bacterial Ig-like domain (group 3)